MIDFDWFSIWIFQGVNKHNGEPVAVKTFNQLSTMRPYEVQIREFEVLKKVKHDNIVKLLAIEGFYQFSINYALMNQIISSYFNEKLLFYCYLKTIRREGGRWSLWNCAQVEAYSTF